MFSVVTRWSFKDSDAEAKAGEFYTWSRSMWGTEGAQSMQRYRIIEGEHAGQHMSVVRFNSQDDYERARAATAERREAMLKDMEAAGVHLEERLLLDEVLSAAVVEAAQPSAAADQPGSGEPQPVVPTEPTAA